MSKVTPVSKVTPIYGSWNKTCKTPTGYGLFPIIMSNDPCKNKFNHASAKSVPTFGRACVLYGELRVKWTCVIIFADFGHGDFLSQNELPKFFFFTAVCLSRVSELPVESLCWVLVLRVQKIFYALVRVTVRR